MIQLPQDERGGEMQAHALRKLLKQDLTDTLIRVVLITLLVSVCVRVFTPFSQLVLLAHLVLLAIILAANQDHEHRCIHAAPATRLRRGSRPSQFTGRLSQAPRS